jgi:hypothetical protein
VSLGRLPLADACEQTNFFHNQINELIVPSDKMSVKITFTNADGNQQTFQRTVDKSCGDCTAASELAALRTHMGQLKPELNAALTVQAEKEKANAASNKTVQNQNNGMLFRVLLVNNNIGFYVIKL